MVSPVLERRQAGKNEHITLISPHSVSVESGRTFVKTSLELVDSLPPLPSLPPVTLAVQSETAGGTDPDLLGVMPL